MTDDSTRPEDRRSPLPRPADLLGALGLLTALPLARPDTQDAAFARATLFFPVVGLSIGAAMAGLNWLVASRLPGWAAGVLLVVAWEACSHAETLRACGGRGPNPGILGLTAMGAVVLIKATAIGVLAANRPAALLFAPMLARWTIVVLAVGARDRAAPARKFNAAVTFSHFAATSVFSCVVVLTVAEALGLVIVVCVAAVGLAARLLYHRWAEGVSWPLLLASSQVVETLVVTLFALFTPASLWTAQLWSAMVPT